MSELTNVSCRPSRLSSVRCAETLWRVSRDSGSTTMNTICAELTTTPLMMRGEMMVAMMRRGGSGPAAVAWRVRAVNWRERRGAGGGRRG